MESDFWVETDSGYRFKGPKLRTVRNTLAGVFIVAILLALIFGTRLSHLDVPLQSGVGIPIALNETGMWRTSNQGEPNPVAPRLYSHVDVPLEVAGIKMLTSDTLRNGEVRLNAPYSYNQRDFPLVLDRGNESIILLISKFTKNEIVNLNIYYLLTFFLNYLAFSYGLFYWLGRLSWFVVLLSIAFAFTPFHFIQGQFFIMNQIGLILCVAVILRILSRQSVSKAVLVTSAVAAAIFGLYWCFFTIIVLSFAVLLNFNHREVRTSLIRLFSLIFLTSSIAAYFDFSGSLTFWRAYGTNDTILRSVAQTDGWSFRIMDLLLLPSYAEFAPSLLKRNFALLDSPVLGESSGLFSPLGMVVLLFCLFLVIKSFRVDSEKALVPMIQGPSQGMQETWVFLMLGVIFIPLVGSMGGLGPVLNLFSLSPIKSWERFAVIFQIFALSLTALFLQSSKFSIPKMISSFRTPRDRSFQKNAMSCLLIMASFLTLFWSVPWGFDRNTSYSVSQHESDKSFFKSVEKIAGNSMVFSFPVEIYPEGPEVCSSIPYASMVGFMYTTDVRWSSGAIKGRDGMWQAAINAMPLGEATNRLADMGFSGMVFDGRGFSALAYSNLVSSLEANSSSPLLFSDDKRWVFVRIDDLLNSDAFSKSAIGFKRIVRPKEETAKLSGSFGLLKGSYTCPSR